MERKQTTNLLQGASIARDAVKNIFPAMAAMVMVLIYNLADTFFIGQTRQDILVAAVSLATPVFLVLMAIGNLFGVGGTSLISRSLGQGRTAYAKKVCSFCMWSCVGVGVILAALALLFINPILALIGASADTWAPTQTYLSIVFLGGPFVLISNCYSNILRAEGQASKAMMGQVVGNLLNIILDPIMISVFDWGIAGAAIATVIGNIMGAGYYILYFLRGSSLLSIRLRRFFHEGKDLCPCAGYWRPLRAGVAIDERLANDRQCADGGVWGYGRSGHRRSNEGHDDFQHDLHGRGPRGAAAAWLLRGAGTWERFKKIIRFSLWFAFALSAAMTLLCYLLSDQIVGVFLTETSAFDYAVEFAHILLTTSVLFGVFFVLVNALQAMGAAAEALIVSMSRQGIIYIPALFLLQALLNASGLVWAQPVADVLSTCLVIVLYCRALSRMQKASQNAASLAARRENSL